MKHYASSIALALLGAMAPSLQAAPAVPIVDSSTSRDGMVAPSPAYTPVSSAPALVGEAGSSPAALLYQLEVLQQEVQTLRGMLEEQSHRINQMREEQRDRYLDLDRRIGLLSSGGTQGYTPTPPSSSTTTETVSDTRPMSSGLDEKSAYQSAFGLIRTKEYDAAIAAFTQFVREFPNGSYTGNAWYWLGEVQVVKANFKEAFNAFDTLLKQFPQHRKTADAMYKLGKVHREMGDRAKAKQILQDVVKQFPGSSAAKLAEAELRSL